MLAYSLSGKLSVFDIDQEQWLWTISQSEPSLSILNPSKPSVVKTANGSTIIVLGSGTGQLNAYSVENGNKLWQKPLGQARGFSEIEALVDVDIGAQIYANSIISAAWGGPITAVDQNTQATLWTVDASVSDTMLLMQDQLIAQTDEDQLMALNAATGETIWQLDDLQFRRLTPLTTVQISPTDSKKLISDDSSILATTDQFANYFFILPSSGELAYHYRGEYPLAMPLLSKHKKLYALNQNGELLAYQLKAR